MKRYQIVTGVAGLVSLVCSATLIATAQLPLGPARTSGQTVTPVYEGWYANPGAGSRTVDEMAHAWVDVTYLSQEDYDAEVARREAANSTNDQ